MLREEILLRGARMLGLIYLAAATLYLALMFFVMRWAWRKGRANGGSIPKATGFMLVGFLVIYLPVFWNHIPILIAHRSMCAKDAGFVAFTTPDQWIRENRSRLGNLKPTDGLDWISDRRMTADGYTSHVYFGGLLSSESQSRQQQVFGVSVSRTEIRIRDLNSGAILATLVNYQVGTPEDARPWLAGHTCYRQGDGQAPWILSEQFHQRLRESVK